MRFSGSAYMGFSKWKHRSYIMGPGRHPGTGCSSFPRGISLPHDFFVGHGSDVYTPAGRAAFLVVQLMTGRIVASRLCRIENNREVLEV